MPRLMAFDYGLKRTGIAVSDPLQIIATGLTSVKTSELLAYVKAYVKQEAVEAFVFGDSLHKDGKQNELNKNIKGFANVLKHNFPEIAQYFEDERYSSKQAVAALVASGVPKKKRKNKMLIDEVSATIILQSFMQTHNNL